MHRQSRCWPLLSALFAAALMLAACVGQPKEVRGEFPSYLARQPGQGAAVAPKDVNGRSNTSGLGAGMMMVAPGTTATPTPTPSK
ncbi:MAG: hypothetical protein M1396_05480 [Chloroflexi bacterium]|nr:hypothetical protein [Chloroflexota bacterium]